MFSSSDDTFHNNPDAFYYFSLYSTQVSYERDFPPPPALLRHREQVLTFTKGSAPYVEMAIWFSTVNRVDFPVLNISNFYLVFYI